MFDCCYSDLCLNTLILVLQLCDCRVKRFSSTTSRDKSNMESPRSGSRVLISINGRDIVPMRVVVAILLFPVETNGMPRLISYCVNFLGCTLTSCSGVMFLSCHELYFTARSPIGVG